MKKHIIKFIILSFALFIGINDANATIYHNQTQKVVQFDYTQYNFTYLDADSIEHTVCITEEATTPEHMMALLREVYTNPNIPGIRYAYDYNGTQYRQIDYNTYGHLGTDNWLGTSTDNYPNPYEDGMTLLLVQVKDDWKVPYHNTKDMKEYFRKAYASIKLIPHFTRINDSQNPGYLFTIDGATNRFFFISKGKPRSTYTKPLFRLFEQISPVNPAAGDVPTLSFIDDMRDGNNYYCYHDCTNVTSMTGGHWFTISNQGETYDLNNLSIFIPDRRFEYELDGDASDNKIDSNFYNEYGNSQNPGEEDWSITPSVMMYRAKLAASLDRNTENNQQFTVSLDWSSSLKDAMDVPEHYWVYSVDDEGNMTLLPSIDNYPTTATHHEFAVDRDIDPKTLHFIVTGALINYDTDGVSLLYDTNNEPLKTVWANSNIASVVVPGLDPYFTELIGHNSRFDIMNQLNIYKNKVSLSPTTRRDYMALKNSTEPYSIIRTDNQGNETTIAQVSYSFVNDAYYYTIQYNDNAQDYDNLYDDEQPVTSGSFTEFSNSSVIIIDRFSATTESNDHSSKYSYRMVQNDDHSNICDINILKTTCSSEPVGRSIDEVEADTVHQIDKNNELQVNFTVANDMFSDIMQYDIYYVMDEGPRLIGKAENNAEDNSLYRVTGLSSSNKLNDYQRTFIVDNSEEIYVIDHNYQAHKSIKHVSSIRTTDNDTYGCERSLFVFPNVDIKASNLVKTVPFWNGSKQVMGYKVDLTVTPSLSNNVDVVYYYRIWRVSDNNEILLNDCESVEEETWFSDYDQLKSTFPGSNNISVCDVFVDDLMDNEKKISYIVRMYSKSSNDNEKYYISEAKATVIFNNNVITSVQDIIYNNVVKTEYYNATGMHSSKPFEGFNIIVMTTKNGNKIVCKKTL